MVPFTVERKKLKLVKNVQQCFLYPQKAKVLELTNPGFIDTKRSFDKICCLHGWFPKK